MNDAGCEDFFTIYEDIIAVFNVADIWLACDRQRSSFYESFAETNDILLGNDSFIIRRVYITH